MLQGIVPVAEEPHPIELQMHQGILVWTVTRFASAAMLRWMRHPPLEALAGSIMTGQARRRLGRCPACEMGVEARRRVTVSPRRHHRRRASPRATC